MLDHFIRHIREKNLLDSNKTYLIAISGGLDSVVLTYLMQMAKIKFILAHCNFGLRGKESDGDEQFVRDFAAKLGKEIFVQHFNTKGYAYENGISTQMAARDLRYGWFDSLVEEQKLAGTVVAHHLDDQVETIMLNLLRGTGIEGLYGMAEVKGELIRPLLAFSKQQLLDFAQQEGLSWREDSSNQDSDYKRNFLRNKVLPLLTEEDPAAMEVMIRSFGRVKDTGRAYFHFQNEWLKGHLQSEGAFQKLSIPDLLKIPGFKSVLFYWLRDFGFNYFQVEDLAQAIRNRNTGGSFHSSQAVLNIDREFLILGKKRESSKESQLIAASDQGFEINGEMFEMSLTPFTQLDTRPSSGMFDLDKVEFPLELRNWREGERFRPLGMKNFKKISDFLIDLKVPLIYKSQVKVLCSRGEVMWVVGYRVDDRYKVEKGSKTVLHIKKTEKE
ncbi:tRNA lysidine(34) synthetase TilS [Litoribacter ruber]|uniref:tRNA lysidine(34) synthetase TilS n=1 Tax=Litoribacter ruber TaxID=702568 RepID=UPI001BDAB495|nr:tRNA lysidine(34) synthetase TilS [Litoribacter ruber]MBT0811142.1 tRNA lysidine(34) synthetase TilS [Litoribacter ruber]